MNEKIYNTPKINETQQLERELIKWKEYQLVGESSGDPDMVAEGMTNQIEYLYRLSRVDEARAFLKNIPDSVDLDQPQVREILADIYVMADDTNYFYDWYRQNLFHREANAGDQILVYALLCHNRNSEARTVFEKTFPALTSLEHFTYALQHIPKLIEDRGQREFYYRTILERCSGATVDLSEQIEWYEIQLKTLYCLNDISRFENTARAMAQVYPEEAQQHLDFLERLKDRNNPKWRENKVFGIGLSKTGTSSLSKALTLLDFSTAHWTNPYSHDLLMKEDIPLFDSLTDITVSYQYREIYEEYPDAKFVLSTRSIEDWEKSFLNHYTRSMHAKSFEELKKIITEQSPPRFGQKYVEMHQELYFQYPDLPEAYRAHLHNVLKFFQGKEDHLLLLDVSQPNALKELADFLEVDCPQSDFPHENTKEEKNSWTSPITGERRTFKVKT